MRTRIRWVHVQNLHIEKVDGASYAEADLQRLLLALLMKSTKLESLSVRADGIPWLPVLGLIHIRHLELTMCHAKPWLDVIKTDLGLCSCLETLKIADETINTRLHSKSLPDLLLHKVASLKSVELAGWHPTQSFALPSGCRLLLAASFWSPDEWEELQAKDCPLSMLYLACRELQAWPRGVSSMSELQYLELYCYNMKNQDLAALQHIPHLCLGFEEHSTFHLTSGSWRSFQITGDGSLSITFSSVDAFVRGTERFHFECKDCKGTEELYKVLRAACMRQGVGCRECKHLKILRYEPDVLITSLRNVERCTSAWTRYGDICGSGRIHERIIHTDKLWPSEEAYPELYS